MPIIINDTNSVYSKAEVDSLLFPKADKVDGAGDQHIGGLTGDEGNLLDTGYTIDDLKIGKIVDFGVF